MHYYCHRHWYLSRVWCGASHQRLLLALGDILMLLAFYYLAGGGGVNVVKGASTYQDPIYIHSQHRIRIGFRSRKLTTGADRQTVHSTFVNHSSTSRTGFLQGYHHAQAADGHWQLVGATTARHNALDI